MKRTPTGKMATTAGMAMDCEAAPAAAVLALNLETKRHRFNGRQRGDRSGVITNQEHGVRRELEAASNAPCRYTITKEPLLYGQHAFWHFLI